MAYVVLVIGQLGKLVGITPEAEGPLPTLADVLGRVGGFHGPTVAVGAARVAVVGDIPSGLPAVELPDAGLGDGGAVTVWVAVAVTPHSSRAVRVTV